MNAMTEAVRRPERIEANVDDFRLSNSPSHLLRRSQQYVSEIFARGGLSDNVTLRQSVVLAAIAEGEGCSQTDLVRSTGVDRSTLAEMVSRMEKKGLISRRADKNDGRTKRVALTAAGRHKLEEALPAMKAVDAALISLLPRNRQSSFQGALNYIVDASIEAQTAEFEESVRLKKAAKAEKQKPKKKADKKARKKDRKKV